LTFVNYAPVFLGVPLTSSQCHYSLLPGNSTISWTDAHLTPLGESQAQVAHAFWSTSLLNQEVPAPQAYYVSPLTRAIQTASITFSSLLPPAHPFKAIIKELARETIGIHTCDRRSNASYIQSNFPSFTLETNFSESDVLWSADLRESNPAMDRRLTAFLDDVFTHDRSTILSVTGHGGMIGSILRVVGHRPFKLQTGGVIPVLVKVVKMPGPRPGGGYKGGREGWSGKPDCAHGENPHL